MGKLTFAGPSARDATNNGANGSRLLNCYREPVQPGGRTGHVVRSVPGMGAWVVGGEYSNGQTPASLGTPTTPLSGPIYSLATGQADAPILCAFYGSALQSFGESYSGLPGGANPTILRNTVGGLGNVTSGGSFILAVSGSDVYVQEIGVSTTTFAAPFGAITEAASISYLGGYAILTEYNGARLQWSNLGITAFPALNFATAETTGENITRGLTVGTVFLAFKPNSISFWQTTAQAGADAFLPIVGREADIGLKAFRLLTEIPNGCAFASSDGKIMVYMGGSFNPISVPALETALEYSSPRDMFYYEVRGHGFICVTFDDCAAWCFDIATGEWHERGQGITDGPWDARCAAEFNGRWVFGMGDGTICVASETLEDRGIPLRREIVSGVLDPGRRVRVNKVEISAKVGDGRISTTPAAAATLFDAAWQGLAYDQSGDLPEATVAISFSKDAGQTFGPEKQRSLGPVGAYKDRLVLRGQGLFRRVNMKVATAHPIDSPIYSDADVEVI